MKESCNRHVVLRYELNTHEANFMGWTLADKLSWRNLTRSRTERPFEATIKHEVRKVPEICDDVNIIPATRGARKGLNSMQIQCLKVVEHKLLNLTSRSDGEINGAWHCTGL